MNTLPGEKPNAGGMDVTTFAVGERTTEHDVLLCQAVITMFEEQLIASTLPAAEPVYGVIGYDVLMRTDLATAGYRPGDTAGAGVLFRTQKLDLGEVTATVAYEYHVSSWGTVGVQAMAHHIVANVPDRGYIWIGSGARHVIDIDFQSKSIVAYKYPSTANA